MLLCADEGAAAAALASGVLACPSCRSGRLRCWGWGARAGYPGAGRDAAAAPPPGQVRLLRRDACSAPGLDGAAARGQHRDDRRGRRALGAARHGQRPARRPPRRGRDRARLARRLRSHAGQLLQEASCEFGRLVAVIDD